MSAFFARARLSRTVVLKRPFLTSCQLRFDSTAQEMQPKWPKHDRCEFAGASATPSILMQSYINDTSIYNEFEGRDNDVFVATPWKTGTTWMQTIISELLSNGDLEISKNIHGLSPWLTAVFPPRAEKLEMLKKQSTRRLIKLHEPIEAISYSPSAKYVFVGRDFRDSIWSMYNFVTKFNATFVDELFNNPDFHGFEFTPFKKVGSDEMSEAQFFRAMMRKPDVYGNPDGWQYMSNLWVMGSWWNARHLRNVKLVHFNQLKGDLSGQMREIAAFLEIDIDEKNFAQLVKNCTFDEMKARSDSKMVEMLLEGGKDTFFFKGTNQRWHGLLTDDDNDEYRNLAKRYLDEPGLRWSETGEE